MTHPPAAGDPLHRVLDALEADPTLVTGTTAAIRETLPGYDEVPAASLEASIHRNLALSIRTLRGGAAPMPRRSTRRRSSRSSGWGRGCRWAACWPGSGCA